MFGLFGKKKYSPTVTPEDKDWIEQNICWFIEVFGLDNLKVQPIILPTVENFPYNDLNDTNQFQKLFERLCRYCDVNPNEIVVKFFDDFKSKQWTTWIPHGEFCDAAGIYNQVYTTDEKRFNIQLAKSNLNHPQLLVSVISHELAHVKLLGGNYMNSKDPDMEPLTDLASIFFGFGIFVANSSQIKDIYWITRTGYLPQQMISYANALICYITGYDSKIYIAELNGNTKDLFKQDYEFLSNTNNTLLTKDKLTEIERTYKISDQIIKGFEIRNLDGVIAACKELIRDNPQNNAAMNSYGYALLQQKNYHEAIEQFTRAIDINPYLDIPYSNRGYCKLQLGELEDAFTDIHSALEMNSENSYTIRNMGAYYLRTNEFEKALEHFEQAQKMDPQTELINFYLGITHSKIENTETSTGYLEKSALLNEHNDSTIK
ncbi:MAG: tetratricopeptide repeat protein [Ignavibacteria bacterium]|nr:tetratricopeptide repeat protein [Ignavibacteria bacterium]